MQGQSIGKEGTIMSRNIVLALMTVAVMLAGCEGQSVGGFAREHKVGLIGGGIGAGIGALAGHAVGHNTTSTLLGAAVGGGIGYLLGNTQDKKRAERYDRTTPTALTGTTWRVDRLNMPNPPDYREMYLSFEPNSQLVTTQVMPDGKVVRAAETYRITDHTLIINRPAEAGQPGYIINSNYAMSGPNLTITSPDFSATCQRVNEIPATAQASGRPF
jgi:uncharacterized protein YcfJ